MNTNIVPRSQLIRKIRPNLYQLPQGHLVGFGPLEAENGLEWCYNCGQGDCAHVEAITQSWLDGMSIEANSIPFNGIAPATEDDRADDYALPQVTL